MNEAINSIDQQEQDAPATEITEEQIDEMIKGPYPSKVLDQFSPNYPGLADAFESSRIRAGFNLMMRKILERYPDPFDREVIRAAIAYTLKNAVELYKDEKTFRRRFDQSLINAYGEAPSADNADGMLGFLEHGVTKGDILYERHFGTSTK